MRNITTALIFFVAGAHGALAQSANDVNGLVAQAATLPSNSSYVDPEKAERNRCFDHPARPEWMMVQPLGYEWRLTLANRFRSAKRSELVMQADRCDCDFLYPDWENYRTEFETMIGSVSSLSKFDWRDDDRERYNMTYDIMTDASSTSRLQVQNLCEGLD